MIENRKEEGRVRSTLYDLFSYRYSPTHSKNRKIAKSVLGFEPGSLEQNTINLPLAPPPLPVNLLNLDPSPMKCQLQLCLSF